MTDNAVEILAPAHAVLADAHVARERAAQRMSAGENYNPEWFAVVGLLRTVNDVVRESAESSGDPVTKRVVAEAWQRVEADRGSIFWQTMHAERQMVVHRYVIGKHAPSHLLLEDGGRILLEDGSGFLLAEKPNLDYIDAALDWWRDQLNDLEAVLRSKLARQ